MIRREVLPETDLLAIAIAIEEVLARTGDPTLISTTVTSKQICWKTVLSANGSVCKQIRLGSGRGLRRRASGATTRGTRAADSVAPPRTEPPHAQTKERRGGDQPMIIDSLSSLPCAKRRRFQRSNIGSCVPFAMFSAKSRPITGAIMKPCPMKPDAW